MFSKELEEVIDAALADGVITEMERKVLHKRAIAEGVDPDELDVVIDGRLANAKKQEDWLRPAPPIQIVNEKHGNVIKCPSCGAQIVGGTAVCPECGYTFSNINANNSAEKLQAKLDEFNRRQEERADNRGVAGSVLHGVGRAFGRDKSFKYKMDIISNFPVPNTRADLLEFLTMIQPKINSTGSRVGGNPQTGEEDLSFAYWLLFSNCINKAKISFINDENFTPYFSIYDDELKKTKGIIGYLRCNPRTRLGIIIVLFYVAFFGLIAYFAF